eukprot:6182370-Pleurochrysis_carterae.AAC.6
MPVVYGKPTRVLACKKRAMAMSVMLAVLSASALSTVRGVAGLTPYMQKRSFMLGVRCYDPHQVRKKASQETGLHASE